MKFKSIVIGIVVLLCAGAGFYFLTRVHHNVSAAGDEDQDSAPPLVAVQVGPLKRMTLHHYLEGYGTVELAPATPTEPAAGAPLAAPTAGVVARVNVAEGQQVEKGQVLMELNSGSTTFEYAQQELQRQQELYRQHNTSLKNLQAAQAQVAALRVMAPLAGTLTRLNVRAGQAVDVTTVVAEVANLARLVVTADLPVSQVNELKPGDALDVQTSPPITATLAFISPLVNTNNSTVAVWGGLPPDCGLRPGQFVLVRLVTALHSDTLAAPEASVVTDLEGRSVISLVHGDEAIRQPVKTGFRENGWVEVSAPGLKAGDAVVTVGAYGLPEKTQIHIVNPPSTQATATNPTSGGTQ
jgi:membrane fusion protein, multidrug efflux system